MAILKDKSKKKKGENIIGKMIYGFLLFMPLIAVGVSCLYTIFNKNAYQSYSDETLEGAIAVTNMNQMANGIKYHMNYKNVPEYQETLKISYISYTKEELGVSQETYENINFILLNPTNQLLRFSNQNAPTTWLASLNWNQNISFDFIMDGENPYGSSNWLRSAYISQTIITTGKLDNVFYYEMEKLETSDLFNWTKNTGAYTVMHNVTSGIGISNTYTPMLMTYWLLISVIYFIFDIALILVWAVHDKIHELKDAI